MAQPIRCNILIDPEPNAGSWNMAVDEALLEAALARGECFVRWYRWEEATLSLGYFQKSTDAAIDSPEFATLPTVRRLTGGGAILHHHELTYSCIVPPEHPLAREPQNLYEMVHDSIVAVLADAGIVAHKRRVGLSQSEEPFLCFGRGDPRDVVIRGKKILGSAQRRRRGAVLQHGSLLLRRSPHAPLFPGLLDLAGESSFDPHDVLQLAAPLARHIHAESSVVELNDDLRRRAAELEEHRYRLADWSKGNPGSEG